MTIPRPENFPCPHDGPVMSCDSIACLTCPKCGKAVSGMALLFLLVDDAGADPKFSRRAHDEFMRGPL